MTDLELLLERALSLGDEGDWNGMAELLREHLAEYDDEAAMHCWLGTAEREMGLDGVSYERFKRALSLQPTDPYVLATAGNAIAAFDDPDAEPALRVAALTAPGVALARLMYGAYLSREGFAEEGIKELEAARSIAPEDPVIAYELGVARYLKGDVDGAADAMGDSVSLNPEEGWVRVVRGLVLLEEGRFEEALGDLSEGAHLRPEDIEAQLTAALAATVIGEDALAYEMLERGRIRADDEDSVLMIAVEGHVEAGPEGGARYLLMEELGPDMLRRRLQERP